MNDETSSPREANRRGVEYVPADGDPHPLAEIVSPRVVTLDEILHPPRKH